MNILSSDGVEYAKTKRILILKDSINPKDCKDLFIESVQNAILIFFLDKIVLKTWRTGKLYFDTLNVARSKSKLIKNYNPVDPFGNVISVYYMCLALKPRYWKDWTEHTI